MPVLVRCTNPSCKQEFRVKEEVVGKSAKCKNCGTTFVLRPAEAAADSAREVSLSMLKDEPPVSPSKAGSQVKPPAPKPAPTSTPTPSPTPASTTTIGRFEVRQRLGAGAFGTVYLAYDPQLQRDVAVKVPQRSVLNNPQRVERFLREARAAAKLRHPNIVPVYDAGQVNRQLYIASAFVKGEPLSEIVDDGGIDLKKAATIVRALAEGLAYAHQEGIVHRDVKPANVMLDDLDQPLLMDFGLAAQVDSIEEFQLPEEEADAPETHDSSRLTRAGSVMGTPSYMAPEIARGLKGEAKPAADQYALGVVLYELVTGRTPFEGPPAAVLHQAINEPPPNPSEFRKDLPKDLQTICLKALAKDPADRYVTCQAMADDLRRWQDGEPIRARKQGLFESARRWMKKEPKLAVLSGGMGVAVLVIIGLLAMLWMQTTTERDAFASDRDKAARERDDAETRRKSDQDAADKALANQRAEKAQELAGEKLAAGDPNAAWTLLQQVPAENRGPAWPFLVAQAEGMPEFRRVLQAASTSALAFQLDSRHLLQVTAFGELVVWDVWTDRVARRLPIQREGLRIQAAAISADGKRIAAALVRDFSVPLRKDAPDPPPSEIVVWDEQGKIVRSLPGLGGNQRIALNRDGTLLAVAGSPGAEQKLSLWNVDTGERLPAMDKLLASVPFPLGPIVFSPDGKLIATTTVQEKGEIRAWEIATGAEKFVIKDRGGDIRHLAFSPDSTRLAAVGGAELEGPEYTTERPLWEEKLVDQMVEIDGVVKTEKRTFKYSRMVTEKHVGYRNLKQRIISKPVNYEEMRKKTEYEAVKVKKTVEKLETVDNFIDGKNVPYQRKVLVEEYVTEMVPVVKEYKVVVTKLVWVNIPGTDPIVRVWGMDGILQTRIVEAEPITALSWRDDGALLATASDRNDSCTSKNECDSCGISKEDRADVKFWDPVTGKLVFALPCSTPNVTMIAFSPDRKHIAVAGGMGITLWSAESRHLLANQRGDGSITDLLFSTDSAFVSAHSKCNQTTGIWNATDTRQIARLPATGPFMQFLPDSRFLANQPRIGSGSHGGGPGSPNLGRWSTRKGASETHPGDRSSVWAYSADGNQFVAGQLMFGNDLKVFDGQTGERVCELTESRMLGFIQKMQVSRDGTRVSALAGNEAILWDGTTGKVLARRWNIGQADLSADGKFWAVATQPNMGYYGVPATPVPMPAPAPKKDAKDGQYTAAPTRTAEQTQANADDDSSFVVQKVEPTPQPKPKTDGPKDLPPSPKDSPLPPKDGPVPAKAPAGPPPQATVSLFDGDGKEVAKLPADFTNSYSRLAFDPTGKFLVGVGDETWVRIWNVSTGKLISQHMTNDPEVAISPDGRFLALHMAQPMNVPSNKKEMPKIMQPPPKVASGNDELPLMFASQLQEPVPTFTPAAPSLPPGAWPSYQPYQPDQPPPGQPRHMWIAVVELATGKLVWQANVSGTGHGGMAFSADGKRIAMGFADCKAGYVQLWDTKAPPDGETFKFQSIARYSGHVGPVNAVAFSPDGNLLASGGDDRMVKVWRLPAEGELGPGSDIPMGIPCGPATPAPTPTVVPPSSKEKIPAPVVAKPEVEATIGSATFGQGIKCMSMAFVGNRLLLTPGLSDGFLAWEIPSGKLQRAVKTGGGPFAVSGDGTRCAAGVHTEDGPVLTLWDTADWKKLHSWRIDPGSVVSPQLDRQGTRIMASHFFAGPVKVWEAQGKLLREFPGPAVAALSSDGKRVALGVGAAEEPKDAPPPKVGLKLNGDEQFVALLQKEKDKPQDAGITIYDVDSGAIVKNIPTPKRGIQWLAMRPDAKIIATADNDTVSLWEVESGKEMHQIKGFGSAIYGVRFSNDGATLAVGGVPSNDKRHVHLIDVATGKRRHELDARGNLTCDFSGDGKTIAIATSFGGFYLWDVATGKEIPRPAADTSPFLTIQGSPDGQALLLAGKDGTIRRWDVATKALGAPVKIDLTGLGKKLPPLEGLEKQPDLKEGPQADYFYGQFSDDGGTLRVTSTRPMKLIDVATGKVKESIDMELFGGQFSKDGSKLVGRGKDGTACIWEVASGRLLLTLKCPKQAHGITITPNGDRLLVYCNSGDGKGNVLVVFDAVSGAELRKVDWPNELSPPLAISPDGRTFVAGDWGYWRDAGRPKPLLKIWDVETLTEKKSFAVSSIGAMLFRPDGKALYTVGQDAVLREWDLEKGTERNSVSLGLQATRGSLSMCYVGPDRIACLNNLGTVTVVRLVQFAVPPAALRERPELSRPWVNYPPEEITDLAGEQKAALAVQKLKGSCFLFGNRYLGAADPLPTTPFGVVRVTLDGGTIASPDLAGLGASKTLRDLNFNNCKLQDDSLAAVRDFQMVHLNFYQTKLSDRHFEDIAAAKRLESVGIAWTGRGNDADVEKLCSLPNLRRLFLTGCPLTNKACASIAKLKYLEELHATGVKISGPDFARLNELPKLKVLNLHKSDVTDADIEALNAPTLESLYLEFTKVTSKSMKRLKEIRTLKDLSLPESAFSIADVEELRRALPSCQVQTVK